MEVARSGLWAPAHAHALCLVLFGIMRDKRKLSMRQQNLILLIFDGNIIRNRKQVVLTVCEFLAIFAKRIKMLTTSSQDFTVRKKEGRGKSYRDEVSLHDARDTRTVVRRPHNQGPLFSSINEKREDSRNKVDAVSYEK